jgi:large subunit ribosomal protein L18
MEIKQKRYNQRKNRVRARVSGTDIRPRLSVYKSSVHIYGQLIDDVAQKTLVGTSDLKIKTGKKVEKAEQVGEELAKLALAKKIKKVTFDRNGFRYHGRVKALAEGARKGGLEF